MAKKKSPLKNPRRNGREEEFSSFVSEWGKVAKVASFFPHVHFPDLNFQELRMILDMAHIGATLLLVQGSLQEGKEISRQFTYGGRCYGLHGTLSPTPQIFMSHVDN